MTVSPPPPILDQVTLHLDLKIRPCTREDLPHLEWFGLFTPHREIFERTFEQQERGEQLMLVANGTGFPVGMIWIDLVKKRPQSTGVLWALRVIPWLQGMGIGTRLVMVAERVLQERGYRCAELGVEPDNPGACRLYLRLGYKVFEEVVEECRFTPPGGEPLCIPIHQTLLRKRLEPPGSHDTSPSEERSV